MMDQKYYIDTSTSATNVIFDQSDPTRWLWISQYPGTFHTGGIVSSYSTTTISLKPGDSVSFVESITKHRNGTITQELGCGMIKSIEGAMANVYNFAARKEELIYCCELTVMCSEAENKGDK